MNLPHISTRAPLSRRHVLRGAGTLLSLPLLEAMLPSFSRAAAAPPPKRFVAMCAGLGFHGPHLFPQAEGRDYAETPYLSLLRENREHFTVFSGLSHPEQNGNNGHASEMTWLTSAKRPGLAGFKNTISIDQRIAEKVGQETRFPSLILSARDGSSLSWTANGVGIPSEASPARLFQALFLEGTQYEVEKERRRLESGSSILDTVMGRAKRLGGTLGRRDQEKLDEYLTSVRDLEARLQQSKAWAQRPKPKVDAKPPKDIADKNDAIAKQRLMYDMIALALQTDSTRTITFQLGAMNAVPSNLPGVKTDWHNLSHHGKDEAKIEELKLIEAAEFKAFNDFLTRLRGIEEADRTLLDQTAVVFGSNLGNASSHDWHNLPVIVAGGGYRHQGYVAHDAQDNTPLANLFVAMAQRMGVETSEFGSSTAETVRGLESV
ncbi:MAG: DUF1552 domain-containing protein [Verrucomicrobiales bacterium]|nr:DUF1552 domain-containing protein [Verrucomicrobiales bacterium]